MQNRFGPPPSKRQERQERQGSWTLESRLAEATLMYARVLTQLNDGLGRAEVIAQIIKDAEKCLNDFEVETTEFKGEETSTEMMNVGDIFKLVYRQHVSELGFPIGDHARERCIAMVRRALEACPDFAKDS